MNSICGMPFARLQRIHQRGDGLDAFAQRRNHGVADAQVGHETRIVLAEADQRLVLLVDAAHRESPLRR
jgi:hypothetical protein